MGIPDEIIKSGSVIIFNDAKDNDDMIELAGEIEVYNSKMRSCKKKKQLLEEIKYAYILLNLLVPHSFISLNAETFFAVMPLAVGILTVNVATFVFALYKNKYWLIAAAAALYTVTDMPNLQPPGLFNCSILSCSKPARLL